MQRKLLQLQELVLQRLVLRMGRGAAMELRLGCLLPEEASMRSSVSVCSKFGPGWDPSG